MRIFKSKTVSRWAANEGVSDGRLLSAIYEIEEGLVDAELGAHLYKKRIALDGRGKRSGARTIIAYKQGERAFFLYGFAKGERDNITRNELKAFRKLAEQLMAHTEQGLVRVIEAGAFVEINHEE